MYYILTSGVENDREDAILEGDSIYLKRIKCSFREGISLPAEDIITPILFKIDQYALRGVMTDHLNLNDIKGPIFSIGVKKLLKKANVKNIQYFQLNLLDPFADVPEEEQKNKEDVTKKKIIEYKDFFIANVIGLVDCVDHENAVLDYFFPPELRNKEQEEADDTNNPFAGENPNHIDSIVKLVLDESKVDPELKIFRLKDQPDLLVFHESVVHLIRKKSFRGFVFVPVSEYTDVIPDDDTENNVKKEPEQKRVSVYLEQKEIPVQLEQKDEPEELSREEEPKEQKKRKFFFD